ncbi:MAG: mevalonate kinase [Thaumarchaeota archaeon]|nr:mevalonate kinase [Nitrososphaerota archaeon]
MRAICEAPGKIILTGEHFVVHKAYALAAAIGKRVRVEAIPWSELVVQSAHSRNVSGLLPVEKTIRRLYADMGADPKVRLRITSQIPNASGLGSSASTMVAAVGAVNKLEGWNIPLDSVVDHAMVGEREIHGRPSGIDVSASALGGVILFRLGEKPKRVTVARETNVLVILSGVRRATGRLIAKVSSLGDEYPGFFAGLCDAMSSLSLLAATKLKTGNAVELGRLMTYNHAVLGRVGASTPELDKIVDICLSSGCLGAKLTGAGGGGSAIALPPRGGAEIALNALRGAGFDGFLTSIPAGGLRAWVES